MVEYIGLLSHIEDENLGESWIEALIHSFNFPNSPILFQLLSRVNNRVGNIGVKKMVRMSDESSKSATRCQCSTPPICDPWSWTKYFPFEKTRVVIVAGQRDNDAADGEKQCLPAISSHVQSHWGKQGVLLLRNYVSPQCEENEEHTAWSQITNQLIEFIANNCPGVLFVLVGRTAMNFQYLERDRRRVLISLADDQDTLFCLCNEKLEQLNQTSIQWKT